MLTFPGQKYLSVFLSQDAGKQQRAVVVNGLLRPQVGSAYFGVFCSHISLHNTHMIVYV